VGQTGSNVVREKKFEFAGQIRYHAGFVMILGARQRAEMADCDA
jgi:hypothetical protein